MERLIAKTATGGYTQNNAGELWKKNGSKLINKRLYAYEDTDLTPDEINAMQADLAGLSVAYPLEEWHEEDGPALFWRFPLEDLPYVSSPLFSDFNEMCELYGWTHFTKIKAPRLIIAGIDYGKEETVNDDA